MIIIVKLKLVKSRDMYESFIINKVHESYLKEFIIQFSNNPKNL